MSYKFECRPFLFQNFYFVNHNLESQLNYWVRRNLAHDWSISDVTGRTGTKARLEILWIGDLALEEDLRKNFWVKKILIILLLSLGNSWNERGLIFGLGNMFFDIIQKVQRWSSRKSSTTAETLTFGLVMMVLDFGFFRGGLKIMDLDGGDLNKERKHLWRNANNVSLRVDFAVFGDVCGKVVRRLFYKGERLFFLRILSRKWIFHLIKSSNQEMCFFIFFIKITKKGLPIFHR